MKLSKSIDFLLENAGPVIQYRLRKEILCNLKKAEEENLLERIYQTPQFKLLQSYVKPDGYIGSGAHSLDNWRGTILHETPLQDEESTSFPSQYHLEALAYTDAWRLPENIRLMADALNHYNAILHGPNPIHVKRVVSETNV